MTCDLRFSGISRSRSLSKFSRLSALGEMCIRDRAQAVVHVAVPVAQLLLEEDLERLGELFGDVYKRQL